MNRQPFPPNYDAPGWFEHELAEAAAFEAECEGLIEAAVVENPA